MPRDNKTPLIQKIAKQAHVAFRAGADNPDPHTQLVSLVTSIRAADLNISPRAPKLAGGAAGLHNPPVTYMHICETEEFSIGVFLLRSGASIPLHDHPGMKGMLKVLYGRVNVRCFDKLEDSLSVGALMPPFSPPLSPMEKTSVWRSALRSITEYSETSGPCLLTPLQDNLHQIDAVGGPTAFLDILAPPYNPDDGRDCHYYRVLKTATEEGTTARTQGPEKTESEEEAWLLEVPQPEDFWCGGEPYPGPTVSV